MKQKLVIIEGSDGVGKSTQARILAEKLNAKLIIQPSKENIVSVVRAEAKLNPAYSALERQLLIAISHTVDAFTEFKADRNIVMDRSYLSGLVYGKATGVPPYEMELLNQILSSVYKENIKSGQFDVHILFLDTQKRLDEADKDVFEQTTKWQDLHDSYINMYADMRSGRKAFNDNERVTLLDVTGKTVEQVSKLIEQTVNEQTG